MRYELTAAQLRAATMDARVLRIEAGPGAGKTETLAARIAHLIVSGVMASQICALTFTRSMAADLKRRIAARLPDDLPCRQCDGRGKHTPTHEGDTGFDCGECAGTGRVSVGKVQIGTLHGLAAGWLRQALRGELSGNTAIRALGLVRTPDFSIALPEDVDDRVKIAQEAIGVKKFTQKALREGLKLTGPALGGWPPETEARRQLRLHDMVTYDDLLVMLQEMLSAGRDGGLPTLGDRLTHLLIDEMQDFSARHWRIVGAWSPRELTYVGDDAQAIYGFLGKADGVTADEATQTRAAYFDHTATVVYLGENFRSGPALVEVGHRVREALANRGACTAMDLTCARPDLPATVGFAGAGETVTDLVTVAIDGSDGPPCQVAVLAASHAELEEASAQLDDAGIPWARLERAKAVWSTELGRVVVAAARAADAGHWTPFDAATVLRALGLETTTIIHEAEGKAMSTSVSLGSGLDFVFEQRGVVKCDWWCEVAACETMVDLADLLGELGRGALGAKLGTVFDRTLDSLDGWLSDERIRQQVPPGELLLTPPRDFVMWLASPESGTVARVDEQRVVLGTIHSAKGLEWDSVVLLNACEGALPPSWARSDADKNEWARALYVAVTRPRKALYVQVPAELRGKPRLPSEVLVEAGLV